MKKARGLAGLGVMGTTLQFPEYFLEAYHNYYLRKPEDTKNTHYPKYKTTYNSYKTTVNFYS